MELLICLRYVLSRLIGQMSLRESQQDYYTSLSSGASNALPRGGGGSSDLCAAGASNRARTSSGRSFS